MSDRPRRSRLVAGAVERASPPTGAVVMGTGIVSVSLSLDGQSTLSKILLGITGAAWVLFIALGAERMRREPARLREEMRQPASLTSVAGTAVLGAGVTSLGWTGLGSALLVLALILWLLLTLPVLSGLNVPATGTSLLLCVATESLAVLAATLAASSDARWLLIAALVPFVLGLGLYALVIIHFDLSELATARGDHWIAGGALAISTLSSGKIVAGIAALGVLESARSGLEDVTVGLWVLTMLWLPALLAAEAIRPRLGYDVRRWATVFPVGMYAACSFVTDSAAGVPAATAFARVWVWVALGLWVVLTLAAVRRAASLLS